MRLRVTVNAATPAEVASQGESLSLRTAVLPTPCGRVFAALAPRGLAWTAFIDGAASLRAAKEGLKACWPKARIKPSRPAVAAALASYERGTGQVSVWVAGTPFQLKVWRALARVPRGRTLSYQALGLRAGLRGARAIGSAVAANPVALLIPCHRVIRADGALGNYHWGVKRKRALLALEAAPAA